MITDISKKLTGLGVAIVTPFCADGSVDYTALRRLIRYVTEGGVDYLVVMGTTGETPTLTPDEKREVLRVAKEENGGRLPLVVGIGGNNTATVIKTIAEFDTEDVDAILSVVPYYNRPAQRGIYEHYAAIARSTTTPIILYNVPSRTGVNMLPETTLALARDFDNIVAVKEASGNIEQIRQLINDKPKGFNIISGDDSLAISVIEAGGEGVISVAANAFPKHFSQMLAASFAGDKEVSYSMWEQTRAAVKMLFAEGNPPGVKAALTIKGLIENNLRLPLVPVTNALYRELAQEIAEKGL
ncbi:MAG: 4-hydroxy-tetrahydrodipicolinate synthase [Tidjanibacter sp.]|nr:4-hydroxy-tetrahydrodipicolinate synthase [Tidjanibacter sp.]